MNSVTGRMLIAIQLIRDGMKVPAGAKLAGVTHQAVYASPLYDQLCAERIERGEKVRRAAHRKRP